MTAATIDSMRHIVIIGGGISGLSAAWFLQQTSEFPIKVTVLEASSRWGGKILTEQVESESNAESPFVIEAGPDSFLTQKPWAVQLARDLGLSDRLIGINSHPRSTYVLYHGEPVPMPEGLQLIVPTKFKPFALTPLLSPLGKLRMALDWLIPARRDDSDETLADFVRRRLGSEALDKIAEPLLSGIYNAESERQSLLATFPRFRQLERDFGSLIRGTLASKRQQPIPAPNAPKPSAFVTPQGGTQELIKALVQQLTCDLRLNTAVTSIERDIDSTYLVTTNHGDTIHADAVLLTAPAYIAADLLRPLVPYVADKLTEIRYVSTGTISLAFRAADVKRPLHGTGLVIPKSEQRPINAITVSSNKFDHRAPEGYVLLRVFFGGSRSPHSMTLDDDQILDVVRQELHSILGIEAAPLFHRIYRWHNANPQYDVGHLDHIATIESALPAGIYATGCAFRGVGVPDCVYQSQQTTSKLVAYLKSTAATPVEATP